MQKSRAQEYSTTFNSSNLNPYSCSRGILSPGRNENPNLLNQASFIRERIGKLKWKELVKVDLDYVIKNNYISAFDALIENLILSKFDENDIQLIQEDSIIKLVRIYQFLLEYLLFSHQKIEGDNKMFENNFKAIIDDATLLETHLKQNQEKLSDPSNKILVTGVQYIYLKKESMLHL